MSDTGVVLEDRGLLGQLWPQGWGWDANVKWIPEEIFDTDHRLGFDYFPMRNKVLIKMFCHFLRSSSGSCFCCSAPIHHTRSRHPGFPEGKARSSVCTPLLRLS